ncbi:C40 family peptidase [Campylobacter troglodytis]|uniref:C40 family peptidase n=1 Tax=Campylobacter troglodytis TaxID=654363 RepID=UPI001159834D|nr:hypothetical protein DMC01_09340 [Campylobacter troglodytis]
MIKKLQLFLSLLLFVLIFNACSATSHNKTVSKLSNKNISSKLITVQKQWQKTPYRLGGVNAKGADCSGFTQTVLSQHFNTKIPRTTVMQMKGGKKISKGALKSGDLLFFQTGRGPNGLHVGIYVQNDEFIHLSTKGGVKKVSLNNSYWKPKYLGARRYIK